MFGCLKVVAIATYENEDTEEDRRAVAENEEYVFPSPEDKEKDTVPAIVTEFGRSVSSVTNVGKGRFIFWN